VASGLASAGPSLSPDSSDGTSVAFQAVYSDPNCAADLNEILLQINTSQSNAGTAWMTPALTPGVAGSASNSQCTPNAGSTLAGTAGSDLILDVALTFNFSVVGPRGNAEVP
jgi:hypothetical protein